MATAGREGGGRSIARTRAPSRSPPFNDRRGRRKRRRTSVRRSSARRAAPSLRSQHPPLSVRRGQRQASTFLRTTAESAHLVWAPSCLVRVPAVPSSRARTTRGGRDHNQPLSRALGVAPRPAHMSRTGGAAPGRTPRAQRLCACDQYAERRSTVQVLITAYLAATRPDLGGPDKERRGEPSGAGRPEAGPLPAPSHIGPIYRSRRGSR